MSGLFASVRLDLEHIKRGYRRYAAYPAATWAGVFTNIVFGFMRVFILLAIFDQRAEVGGYDRAAAVTYVWLGQGLFATTWVFGWRELALRIRSGDIANDLVRPVAPLRAGVAFDVGRAAYHLLFRGAPPVLVGSVTFGIVVPGEAAGWIATALSLALAVIISFAFRWIYNVLAFWLLDDRGTMLIAVSAASLLSGLYIPVHFFPDWLGAIARATPFPAMVQVPIDVAMGRVTGAELIAVLAGQLAWAIALLILAQLMFAAGVRRLVVQGG